MAVPLRPFPADSAEAVSGWARTPEEVIMWCGHPAAAQIYGHATPSIRQCRASPELEPGRRGLDQVPEAM
jgi:hypothetical protein